MIDYSFWWWRRRRGNRKWLWTRQWHRNGPKQASPEQDDSQFLRGNMSLCVLFELVGWFVCSEVVSRHCRGKRVTSVRLHQRETVTHHHRITFHFKRFIHQLFWSVFPCKLVHVCCLTNIPMHVCFNDCVNVIHSVICISPWIEVWDAREVFHFIECWGVYLSFCRLMLLFKPHVHLCAHTMELHTHIQAVRASQKHVLVSCVVVTLFAETLIINMLVTDDVEALLPSV